MQKKLINRWVRIAALDVRWKMVDCLFFYGRWKGLGVWLWQRIKHSLCLYFVRYYFWQNMFGDTYITGRFIWQGKPTHVPCDAPKHFNCRCTTKPNQWSEN